MGRKPKIKEPFLGRPLPKRKAPEIKSKSALNPVSKPTASNVPVQIQVKASIEPQFLIRVVTPIVFNYSQQVFFPASRARFCEPYRISWGQNRKKCDDDTIPKSRIQYTIEKKLLYIRKYYEMNERLINSNQKPISKSAFAEMNNIPANCFLEWLGQETDMKIRFSKNKGSRRLLSVFYPGYWPVLDDALRQHLKNVRNQKLSVNIKSLKEKALEFASILEIENFKASNGYIYRFMRRNKIVRRKITHKSQIDTRPIEVQQQKIINFFMLIDRVLWRYLKPLIINMDETPFFFDMARDFTLDFKGTESIDLVHTGHDKLRFSAVITIASSGEKLSLYLIFR